MTERPVRISKCKANKRYEFGVKVRSVRSDVSRQFVQWSYAVNPTPSRLSELHRKEAKKSVCGPRLPQARYVRFAGFHILWCEYKAETSAQAKTDNQASGWVHQE